MALQDELKTIPVGAEKGRVKFGFVGNVNYVIGKDRKYAKLTDALLSFSRYSNVGGGRTSGMGVVETWSEPA